MHARAAAGRSHGLKRRGLRRLLRLPPPHRARGIRMNAFVCPAPIAVQDTVLLGHGSGGKLSAALLQQIFLPAFRNPLLSRLEDQAVLSISLAIVEGLASSASWAAWQSLLPDLVNRDEVFAAVSLSS